MNLPKFSNYISRGICIIKNRKKTIKKLIGKIKKRFRSLSNGIVRLYFDGYLVDPKYYEESIEDYFLKSKKIPSYVYIGTHVIIF